MTKSQAKRKAHLQRARNAKKEKADSNHDETKNLQDDLGEGSQHASQDSADVGADNSNSNSWSHLKLGEAKKEKPDISTHRTQRHKQLKMQENLELSAVNSRSLLTMSADANKLTEPNGAAAGTLQLSEDRRIKKGGLSNK
jgi:hypothetical protein